MRDMIAQFLLILVGFLSVASDARAKGAPTTAHGSDNILFVWPSLAVVGTLFMLLLVLGVTWYLSCSSRVCGVKKELQGRQQSIEMRRTAYLIVFLLFAIFPINWLTMRWDLVVKRLIWLQNPLSYDSGLWHMLAVLALTALFYRKLAKLKGPHEAAELQWDPTAMQTSIQGLFTYEQNEGVHARDRDRQTWAMLELLLDHHNIDHEDLRLPRLTPPEQQAQPAQPESVDSNSDELEVATRELATVRAQLEAANRSLEGANTRIQELEEKADRLKQERDSFEEGRNKYEREYNLIKDTLTPEDQRRRVTDLNREIAELKQQLEQGRQQREQLEQDLEEARRAIISNGQQVAPTGATDGLLGDVLRLIELCLMNSRHPHIIMMMQEEVIAANGLSSLAPEQSLAQKLSNGSGDVFGENQVTVQHCLRGEQIPEKYLQALRATVGGQNYQNLLYVISACQHLQRISHGEGVLTA